MDWIWTKLGRVFCPDGTSDWMRTHAANPFADHLRDDIYRIYFSCRNESNQSLVAFVDIDLNDPTTLLRVSESPVVEPGELGGFDDSGISLGNIVNHGGRKWLFYLGWNLGSPSPLETVSDWPFPKTAA